MFPTKVLFFGRILVVMVKKKSKIKLDLRQLLWHHMMALIGTIYSVKLFMTMSNDLSCFSQLFWQVENLLKMG